MAFEIKKKAETPPYNPKEKNEWLLQKERQLGIGRHMQFMEPSVRLQVIKRRQADYDMNQAWQKKKEEDNKQMILNRQLWKKRWGFE